MQSASRLYFARPCHHPPCSTTSDVRARLHPSTQPNQSRSSEVFLNKNRSLRVWLEKLISSELFQSAPHPSFKRKLVSSGLAIFIPPFLSVCGAEIFQFHSEFIAPPITCSVAAGDLPCARETIVAPKLPKTDIDLCASASPRPRMSGPGSTLQPNHTNPGHQRSSSTKKRSLRVWLETLISSEVFQSPPHFSFTRKLESSGLAIFIPPFLSVCGAGYSKSANI
jgi:hypothetical protein